MNNAYRRYGEGAWLIEIKLAHNYKRLKRNKLL